MVETSTLQTRKVGGGQIGDHQYPLDGPLGIGTDRLDRTDRPAVGTGNGHAAADREATAACRTAVRQRKVARQRGTAVTRRRGTVHSALAIAVAFPPAASLPDAAGRNAVIAKDWCR